MLENRSINLEKMINAQETLETFMRNNLPHRINFIQTMAPILTTKAKRFPITRVYGEMVDILLEQKNFAAVIELERLWNDLTHQFKFSLLCGYASQMDKKQKPF